MARKWLNLDPDSLAGKLSLLLFDKIVLGAAIALAFIAYDRWKITDQRSYEDKVTLAFQRANYVKELVPIVTDSKQDIAVRAQALTALIETRSVGDSSAFALTERLLEANLIRSDYPRHLDWERRHPLLDALQQRMPAGLEVFLEQYYVHIAKDRSSHDSPQYNAEIQSDAEEFWSELFYRTVERNKDDELQVLNDDDFLDKHLWQMDRLIGLVGPEAQHRLGGEWFARKPKGVRLLAALRGIGKVGRTQHAAGLKYIVALITPPNMTELNAILASQLIQLLEERQWASKALATRCVEIMLRSDAEVKLHPYEFHPELSASSYLRWYANSRRDSSDANANGDGSVGWLEIEPVIAAALMTYLARVANEPIDASDFNNGRPSIARPLAEILIHGILTDQKPSEATLQVLSKAFSLSDTELKALILEDLRSQWIQAEKKLSPAGP